MPHSSPFNNKFPPRLNPAVAATRHAVRSALEQILPKSILVAASGGCDSIALAAASAFVCQRLKIKYFGVCIDHNLQKGSYLQACKAAQQLSDLGFLDVFIQTVDTSNIKGGIENAARVARYRAIESVRKRIEADCVLLGHTMDDQAETVLLGLLRGSGPRSLAGMKMHTGFLLRPFLGIRKSQTQEACIAQNLDYWQDPHNADTKFTRILLREEILPYLESKLGDKLCHNLARTAHLLQQDLEFTDSTALSLQEETYHTQEDEYGNPVLYFFISKLISLHSAIASRIIKQTIFKNFNTNLHYVHMNAINRLIYNWHGQKSIFLPKISVKRENNTLIIQRFFIKSIH